MEDVDIFYDSAEYIETVSVTVHEITFHVVSISLRHLEIK